MSFSGTNEQIPSDYAKEWGDTVIVQGHLYNDRGDAISGYPVKLYSPVSGNGYSAVDSVSTSASGLFTFEVKTGSGTGKDDVAGSGTWYVGTERAGTYRADETNDLNIANFIAYESFIVGTKDDAQLRVRNTDDIISGFDQTVNVSVYNSSWMNEGEFQNMQIHVTGLDGYNSGTDKSYDDDDVVLMSTATWTDANEDYCYYTFSWRFNETGTGTIIATWPGSDQTIQKTTSVSGVDNDEEDLLVNVSGSKTFSVVSPDDINMIIQGTMVDRVQVTESGLNSDLWQNSSDTFVINIFGDTQAEPMNATLEITGCGLDIRINESDTIAENDYLVAKSNGNYTILIAPKTAGTLTITATNGTGGYVATKDYTIYGLSGSVTTSVGDDLEIEVESTEVITATITNGQYAEVHLTLYDENWVAVRSTPLNDTTGDNTAGNGLNGVFEFTPKLDYIDDTIGYIVVAAKAGGWYMYDIVEIVPVDDLVVTVTSQTEGNQTYTVGIPQDITVQITRESDGVIIDDVDSVIGEIEDEHGNLKHTLTFTEDGDYWKVTDSIIGWAGTLKITATNNTDQNQHEGSSTYTTELATITFAPDELTCAIGLVNQTITVTTLDALGNPLPEDTRLYLNNDAYGTTTNRNYVDLDEDGAGEFIVRTLGDEKGKINFTLEAAYAADVGNATIGQLTISLPVFTIDPETIYIGQSNVVTIWAKDSNGEAIEGINLTLWGNTITQPEPVMTNSDGKVIFSLEPRSSGYANVTIARNVTYTSGVLTWTNDVITEDYVTIDSLSTFTITVSKSPIYQGETLTVTVKSGTSDVSGVDVTFGELTGKTDSSGQATFTVPDPGVESAIYTITAEKAGYITKEKSITVIKVYTLSGTATYDADAGTVTVSAILIGKGAAVGATITFNSQTETTDAYGQATFTAPTVDEDTEYTATITYDGKTATATVTVKAGTPGFELLTLIAAIGVAFILLKRRRNK